LLEVTSLVFWSTLMMPSFAVGITKHENCRSLLTHNKKMCMTPLIWFAFKKLSVQNKIIINAQIIENVCHMSQQGQHVVQKLFEICDPIKLSKHLGKIYFKKYNFVLEHFYDCRSKDLFLLGRRGIMISPTSYKQLLS